MASEEILNRIIELRLLVGFLGEKEQAGWWDTSFLNSSGLEFMRIAFPRSFLSAALSSVSEAARLLHDRRIGRNGVYHLFRLPIETEEQLHRMTLQGESDCDASAIESRETAMAALRSLSGELIDAPEGPVQVGVESRLFWKNSIEEIAKHYVDGFERGKEVFPYFTSSDK